MSTINKYYFFIIFIILTVSFFYFGTYRNWPYKVEGDGKYYYQYLVSGIYDHDFDFSNNYRAEKYPWMVMDIDHYNLKKEVSEKTRRPVNYWTIGPALLWLPFFIIASLLGKLFSFFNIYIDQNPFGAYMQYATMFSSVFYTLTSLYLLNKIITRYYTESSSKLSLWLILFTTPLYYYTIFEPSLSHVCDFFTFTLVFYLSLEFNHNKSIPFYILYGLACSLHVLVRTQNIVSILIMFTFIAVRLFRKGGADHIFRSRYLYLIATMALGLLPILLTNAYLYGSPFTIPQGEGFLRWSDPQIIPMLFSYRNGFFSHHPVLLIGTIGYVYSLFRKRYKNLDMFFALLAIFIVQTYINSTVEDWWSGHSFGQRRLLFILPLIALGLTFLIDAFKINFRKIYNFTVPLSISLVTILWFYLTMIHVFIWDYNEPHNIYKWMFYYAPKILSDYYGFSS